MLQLFEALTVFDWIHPAKGFIEDLLNDPTPLGSNSWTFFIDNGKAISGGWNAQDVGALMRRYNIHTWGWQYSAIDDQWLFTVPLDQARWAEFLLYRYGVPIDERYSGAPAAKHRPAQRRGLVDFDSIFDVFRGGQ